MAGIIHFDYGDRWWSASSAAFEDVLFEAIAACTGNDSDLVSILRETIELRMLDLTQLDRRLQSRVTERVLSAAVATISRIRADVEGIVEDIPIWDALANAAREHLLELGRFPSEGRQ